MRLRDLLNLTDKIAKDNDLSAPLIVGGIPRDKVLGILGNEITDVDLTTCDASVHELAQKLIHVLQSKYDVQWRKMNDGHTSIFIGDTKIDFSSNFLLPKIDSLLEKKGIEHITDVHREMYSRDFTCNALLMTLDFKTITDPTNMGIKDIGNKLIRTCLDPNITLRFNPNRIIRVVYLAAKLGFKVEPSIIEWIKKNKEFVRLSTETYLANHIDKALNKNPKIAVSLIHQMDIWNEIPITEKLYPYYSQRVSKTAQLRRNYDYGENVFENLDKYKSIADFRKKRRKRRKKEIKKIKEMHLK